MIDLDFRTIRNHDGSRDNGFEELICQLAHLDPPNNASYFVRKDGAGGDGGVECFWKLKDGSEYGWQAKYFLDPITSSQWGQINDSVEKALKKHPSLTRYYVCTPRDLNDSRKKGNNGKQVRSALDIWREHVEKWSNIASSKGMQVEFIYWGKHDISMLLQRDQPEYAGRAYYWFGTPILTTKDFERLARISEQSLGERYTPELHVHLPINETLKAFGDSFYWENITSNWVNEWVKTSYEYLSSVGLEVQKQKLEIITFDKTIEKVASDLSSKTSDFKFLFNYLDTIKKLDKDRLDYFGSVVSNYANKEGVDLGEFAKINHKLELANNKLINFISSFDFIASTYEALLVDGEAGIGKSHLLCDIALDRINKNLPTVFMLGQHYEGGNPITAIKNNMDLSELSDGTFLGALNASGEASKSKALIIIDAINEGNNRTEWLNFLGFLITEISNYPNIRLLISCRSTYIDWLVPEELIGDKILKVKHEGFKGYEHKASAIYLSKQGISKPSAPILAPEFSNPLFLKTCCKAIKDQGLDSFPKGLSGITSLLEFYINNIERIARKTKGYRKGENIVSNAFKALALKLYPDNQFGLALSEAMQIINELDSRPNPDNSLFDLLLDEGVISEDLMFNVITQKLDIPVIRFTYERFSDYFIASSLLESIDKQDLKHAFSDKGVFAPIVDSKTYYKHAGVFNAIATIIPEKYQIEIVDLISEDFMKRHSIIEDVFIETILWRSPLAFTERTLEIFNEISNYRYDSIQLNTLLALSTEPEHPWNAEFIHRNLINKSLPERDRFWSTYIAISDYQEEESGEESNLRSLIEWAYLGSLEDVETERVRLCLILLIWMTSTSNRTVRDQATKAAVRLLSRYPKLIVELLNKFKGVDDLYVVERLYAVAYGAVTNNNNDQCLKETAQWIWDNEFKDNRPTPHLLLRDYARGIMEYALVRDQLDHSIQPEIFRPPYDSSWPLDIPTRKDLVQFLEDSYSSIESSVLNGDFGIYSMSCINDWSPTLISKEKPEKAFELQQKFAIEHVEGQLKDELLLLIADKILDESKPIDISKIQIQIVDASKKAKSIDTNSINNRVSQPLSSDKQDYFNWVMGLGWRDSIANFDKQMAQRWVCKRAFELGWKKELFEDFERNYVTHNGRMESKIERIGKKYQWIALYEFLAHLADNCHYIDPGYSDVDYSQYYGPWQLYKRDIDPTFILRDTKASSGFKTEVVNWWQPHTFNLKGGTLHELKDWLWNEENLPDFRNLLNVKDLKENSWLVLKSFTHCHKDPVTDRDELPYQNVWYRINSCIVKKTDLDEFKKSIETKLLCDPSILEQKSYDKGFFREYPWHPVYNLKGWNYQTGRGLYDNINKLIPIEEYQWEKSGSDQSIESSISIFLPANELIEGINLRPDFKKIGNWTDNNQNLVFFDPSVTEEGPQSALILKEVMFKWLEDNDLQLVWLIGGEKQLFTDMASKFFGRLNFNGFYTLTEDGIKGEELWFEHEEPSIED